MNTTNWTILAEHVLSADASAPPPGWRLLRASRSAVVFCVNERILVKRAKVTGLGGHVAPLSRVSIEAEAPQFLGRWAPGTLYVDSVRGILVRRFAPGEMLLNVRAGKPDLVSTAKDFGRWFTHVSTITGPVYSRRALPVLCVERLGTAKLLNGSAIQALTQRILDGSCPCHGDLLPTNVILDDSYNVRLIDAETLDRGSVAWDLGHVFALAISLNVPLSWWRRQLLSHVTLPNPLINDADLVAACLNAREGFNPAYRDDAITYIQAAQA